MTRHRETPDERARRALVEREYAELYTEVESILFRHDPMGINFEENTDEYSPEVGTILPRLREADTPRELQVVIQQEFTRWFSSETAGPEDRYLEIAKDVYDAMLRHYAAKGAAPRTWLWSCKKGTSAQALADSLGLENTPVGELDATEWASDSHVMDDLMSLGLPDYFGRNWDAADESLGELLSGGYLLVIRNIRRGSRSNAGRVVGVVATLWKQPPQWWPSAPVVVVLPGWRRESIESSWPNGENASHPVRPLTL